ncbi:hypothetical protein [Methylomonas albis]|nr:hypothetical protein [Methylomonas albis]
MFFTSLAFVSLFKLLSVDAHASTTDAQTPIDGGDAIFANASSGAIIADNFSVASDFDFEALTWWGSYDTSDTDDFIIHLYGDAGGIPGASIYSYSSTSVNASTTLLTDISGAPVYRYDFNLPSPVSLTAGNYFLSITNETTQSGWYWLNGSGGDNQQWALASDGITWAPASASDLAFSVQYTETAVVPVPPAFLLMMSGLLLVGRNARIVNIG